MAGRGRGGDRGRGNNGYRPQPYATVMESKMDFEKDAQSETLASTIKEKRSTPTKSPMDPISEEDSEATDILNEMTFEELFGYLDTEALVEEGNKEKILFYLNKAKENVTNSKPVSTTASVSSCDYGTLISAVDGMRSDLSNFLMGQEDFTKNNIQVGTPVLPPERSYALAAARSLPTTGAGDHNKMNIIGQPKVNSFGAKVYQNCLIFENISQQPAEEEAVVFFQDLINLRLSGRVRPLKDGDISCVSKKDGGFSVFFSSAFKDVESILENAFCFSQMVDNKEEAIYVSPLLSPEELKFQTQARGMAIDVCKDTHKGREWWRRIKIFGSGYKLKVKVPLEGKEGFRSIFLDMRGLGSPLDSNLKAKILDIVKKVELSLSIPSSGDKK